MLPYIKIFADTGATVDMLSDAEAGRLLKALLHYNTSGKEDSLPGQERLIFAMLKAQIDRDNNSYATKCETLRENGKKGGRPKNQTKPNGFLKKQMVIGKTKCFQEEEKEKEEEQEQEYDKDQEHEHEQEGVSAGGAKKSGRRFSPPTLEDVAVYCESRQNGIDPEKFIDYYTAIGWKVGGKSQMKDWRAAVRNWEQRDRDRDAMAYDMAL